MDHARDAESKLLLKMYDDVNFDECEHGPELCRQPERCIDQRLGYWSRGDWQCLLPSQVERISEPRQVCLGSLCFGVAWYQLAVYQVSVFVSLFALVLLLVLVLPRWVPKWRAWKMQIAPVIGAVLQLNSIWTDSIFFLSLTVLRDHSQSGVILILFVVHFFLLLLFNVWSVRRFVCRKLRGQPWLEEAKQGCRFYTHGFLFIAGILSTRFLALIASNLFGLHVFSLRLMRPPDAPVTGSNTRASVGAENAAGEDAVPPIEDGVSAPVGSSAQPCPRPDTSPSLERDEVAQCYDSREDLGLCLVPGETPPPQIRDVGTQTEDSKSTADTDLVPPGDYLSQKEVTDCVIMSTNLGLLFEEVPQLMLRFAYFAPGGRATLPLIVGTIIAFLGLLYALYLWVKARRSWKSAKRRWADSKEGVGENGVSVETPDEAGGRQAELQRLEAPPHEAQSDTAHCRQTAAVDSPCAVSNRQKTEQGDARGDRDAEGNALAPLTRPVVVPFHDDVLVKRSLSEAVLEVMRGECVNSNSSCM
mmetsp:Transcript_44486/g.87913  ORF Transcript_44486/g.87913 Transcript_44486/m.87913 type:complete len:531 (-) Transcript_44486:80-1672(-)